MKLTARQVHPLTAWRFYALLAISLVCCWSSPGRADEAAETAARRKADELIGQAEKLVPDRISNPARMVYEECMTAACLGHKSPYLDDLQRASKAQGQRISNQ